MQQSKGFSCRNKFPDGNQVSWLVNNMHDKKVNESRTCQLRRLNIAITLKLFNISNNSFVVYFI